MVCVGQRKPHLSLGGVWLLWTVSAKLTSVVHLYVCVGVCVCVCVCGCHVYRCVVHTVWLQWCLVVTWVKLME